MNATPEIWTPPPVSEIPHHHDGPCECEPTVAYLRVSKVGLRQMLVSPDIQLGAICSNCQLKNKRIVKVVCDIDKSGRSFSKRSVDGVIRDIGRGVARSVTVYKWSRWGRNVMKSLAYLQKVKDVGGRVDSATEDIDESTAAGRFSRDMIMRVDQLQSEQIGEGWQSVHEQRRADGLPHDGRARFGYDYTPATREAPARYTVSPVEGPALRDLYQRYVGGESFRALARWLNGQGFRTALGGRWTREGVGQVLDTGFGAGWLRERSEEALERQRRKPARNSINAFDLWRPGAHAPVIGEDLWRAYKARRGEQALAPPRARTATHALSSLLFCHECSHRMSPKKTGPKRIKYWICSRAAEYHPGTPVSIGNDRALGIVRAWVAANAGASAATVDGRARAALGATAARTRDRVRADQEKELRSVERLIDMLAREKITEDEFDSAKARAETRLAQLAEEYASLAVTFDSQRPDYTAFRSLDESWDEAVADGREVALNAPLGRLVAFVIVSPAGGRGRWHNAADRVEVVGRWESGSKRRWLEARRRRFSA